MILPMLIDDAPAFAAHPHAQAELPAELWGDAALIVVDDAAMKELEARAESWLCRAFGARIPGHEGPSGRRLADPPLTAELLEHADAFK